MTDLNFEFEWIALPDLDMDPAESWTFANMRIRVTDWFATELEDLIAKTLRQGMHVSAYPLALFFAANWWRLRWEPRIRSPIASWRMAHSTSAADHGYTWPNLTIASDGEGVHIVSEPTSESLTAPVRYISDRSAWIQVPDFEQAVDRFIDAVICRLRESGIHDSELDQLWTEVTSERRDPVLQQRRILEALAGWDPDEAPSAFLDPLETAEEEFGKKSVNEIVASSRQKTPDHLRKLRDAKAHSIEFDLSSIINLRSDIAHLFEPSNKPPWRRAASAANLVRRHWGIPTDPITNARLSEALQTESEALDNSSNNGSDFYSPYSASFATTPQTGTFVLNRRPSTSRRFALCRLLADRLQACEDNKLSAATDAATAPQKFQRAFAQELLCPVDALVENIGTEDPEEIGEKEIEDAAEHFQVSPRVVNTALVNHGYLPPETLDNAR